uniref:Uncharacterized protein n=1 Tax=Arion vulgaris TaxID=1028688 RepID=A0A0B6ZNH2_9EUPU
MARQTGDKESTPSCKNESEVTRLCLDFWLLRAMQKVLASTLEFPTNSAIFEVHHLCGRPLALKSL